MLKSHFNKYLLLFSLIAIGIMATASESSAKSPTDDAVAFWNFDSLDDSNGKNSRWTPTGNVQIGVPLSESEKKESILRGGDGKVAKFQKGSYLSAGQGADSELNITGQTITIALRVRSAHVKTDCPLFSKYGNHDLLSYNLFICKDFIGAETGTTQNKTLLSAKAFFQEMRDPKTAMTRWHDIVYRVNSAKLELFVDGRCVDEDFMLGDLRTNTIDVLLGAQKTQKGNVHSGFEGEIDYLALWKRALSDEEILLLAGGKDRADLRQRTDRGNGESMQYWTPPNQYGVGDCMPFYHDGVFHFVYLLDKYHHRAKNGFGAHQWIQATSTDLIHWTHQPFVVPITEQHEGSICTGSLFWNDGTYYAFYANRTAFHTLPNGYQTKGHYGLLAYSTSKDGIHFTKGKPEPMFYLPNGYEWGTRDPVVCKNEKDGLFHLYATSSLNGRNCWLHAVSKDLKKWSLLAPVYSARKGNPECPDYFFWKGKYYMIAGHGSGFYRISDSPNGPWDIPVGPNVLMQGITRVPKTAPFGKDRRIICGWTGQKGFGGNAVFHELVLISEGFLGEKFVPEMIPATGSAVVEIKDVRLKEKTWTDLPGNYRMQAVLEFDPMMRDSLDDWIFTLADKKTLCVSAAKRSIFLFDREIEQVDFTKGKIVLDLIIKEDIVDLCVNDCRTLTMTLPAQEKRSGSIQDLSFHFTKEIPLGEKSFQISGSKGLEAGYLLRSFEIRPVK